MGAMVIAIAIVVGFLVLMSFVIFLLWYFKFGGKELMKNA